MFESGLLVVSQVLIDEPLNECRNIHIGLIAEHDV